MKYYFWYILIFYYSFCPAQDDTTRFCNPKLEGMARSKGFNISYERIFNYHLVSESLDTNSIDNGSADVRTSNKLDILLRLPIWNKPGLKVVWGFRYFFEEFNFDQPENLTYDLYKNLDDKNLQSIGTNFNILKPLDPVSYIGIRIMGEFNGDYTAEQFPKKSFLKYSFAVIYGRKPCPTRTAGFGIYYSYTFGRRSIYPVILYSNTFNEKWGLESLLPASLVFRRNFSEKTLLYLGYKFDGAAYHLEFDNPPLGTITDLELRRTNLSLLADFEREIHDWLWFGVSSGLRIPVNFSLAKQGARDPIIESYLRPSPFVYFSIFVVPPRTLENRILNAK